MSCDSERVEMPLTPQLASTSASRVERNTSHRTQRRQTRRYGFACRHCRRRKSKCDGNLPSCDRCIENKEACVYDKAPSVKYAIEIQDRLQALEGFFARLRNVADDERLILLREHLDNDMLEVRDPQKLKPAPASDPPLEQDNESTPLEDRSLDDEATIMADGCIYFFGRTSRYRLQQEDTDSLLHQRQEGRVNHDTINNMPIYGMLNKFGHPPGVNQVNLCLASTGISGSLFKKLLDIYWCWPHHLHLVLSRKLFMNDLATSGPYVTEFLLNSTLADAARFSDRQDALKLSDMFAKKALACLAGELEKGSSIPTVQALLILSVRECACGRTSQGWLYSGMAFRMMRDLGLHVHPELLDQLHDSETVLALRRQVFWSCYTWDKTISMCIGRPPMILEKAPVPGPEDWLDGSEMEHETWSPRFNGTISVGIADQQVSHTSSRFSAYCQLCTLIADILDALYSRSSGVRGNRSDYYQYAMGRVNDWMETLPPHLLVQKGAGLISCPPLHVLLLNLMYHALIILICRPYRSMLSSARATATKSAVMIDYLATLHVRRFGFRVLTYVETYTIFVGATVNMSDLKEGNTGEAKDASARLAFNLEILRNAKTTISSTKCVEVLEQALKEGQVGNSTAREDDDTEVCTGSKDQHVELCELPQAASNACVQASALADQQMPSLYNLPPQYDDDNPDFDIRNGLTSNNFELHRLFEDGAMFSEPNKSSHQPDALHDRNTWVLDKEFQWTSEIPWD